MMSKNHLRNISIDENGNIEFFFFETGEEAFSAEKFSLGSETRMALEKIKSDIELFNEQLCFHLAGSETKEDGYYFCENCQLWALDE